MQRKTIVEAFAGFCLALSAAALLVMMLVLVADVLMSNLFRSPIIGTFDLVETTLVLVVFLGFPATFLAGSHIAVDVIDFAVSGRTVSRLKQLSSLISLVFLVFLAFQMIEPALDALKFGERKPELGLPLFAIWVPMIFGIAASAVMAMAVIVKRPAHSSDDKKE